MPDARTVRRPGARRTRVVLPHVIKVWMLRLLLVGLVVGFWVYETGPGNVNAVILPKIGDVAGSFIVLLGKGTTWTATAYTVTEMVCGFALASAVGVGVGFLISRRELSASVAERLLSWGYMYPFVLMYPLFILWLGVGMSSKIGFGATTAFFPIAFNTVRGLRSVDQQYLKVGQAFGASRLMVDVHIKAGGARPMILSGLRIGVGMVSVSVIFAELLGSYAGLGHTIESALNRLDVVQMYSTIVFLLILTFCFQTVMERLLRVRHQ